VAACTDDPGVQRLLRRADRAGVLRYGTGPEAELRAAAIDLLAEGSRFRLVEGGEALGWIELRAPGMHNVRNALGAFALARHFGADLAAAQRALADFDGVGRRFERLAAGNIALVTDYAHHPTEIEATLAAARGAFRDRRLVAAFQPHLYSRTKDFAADFGRSLAAADIVFVTDVYAARELPVPGVTGELVADATRRAGGRAVYYHPDITTLPETLSAFLMPGDACIAMGAGSIDGAARALARLLAGRA
jgi:UDP-N-acetylmuramate--alanine ligase